MGAAPKLRAAAAVSTVGNACAGEAVGLAPAPIADQRKPHATALNATAAHTNNAAAGSQTRDDALNTAANDGRWASMGRIMIHLLTREPLKYPLCNTHPTPPNPNVNAASH